MSVKRVGWGVRRVGCCGWGWGWLRGEVYMCQRGGRLKKVGAAKGGVYKCQRCGGVWVKGGCGC
jgi:hypothetical protein